ncbi:two component transcriptional regulator, LytTR family [Dethiosulfatibacter aminovorans DSM 17477]|uniref:Two component transcriptional regulator, LytTR family n=1 Tax=Dethiosulfatibacter aminovorans DSM 17477 TaxID=1121476 RepID=A0A1M6GFH8_9FIRM|nr:LytTR family DNA-binding domain-containing protein [Dethiosulfatibacter aminovorans]SHJ08702.1 two component transcriptional regulator, LytTR family [Dethiosulfatibacter aminovorans DSM 17477]
MNSRLKIFSTGSSKEAYEIAMREEIDVFFIDINLFDGDGMKLAENLRGIKKYEFTKIVFITSVVMMELEAYRNTQCYEFVVKNFDDGSNLERVMKKLLIDYINYEDERYNAWNNRCLELNYNNSIYKVPIKDIIFVEYLNRRIYVQTKNERIRYKCMPMMKVIEDLPKDFVQVHQSIVINKNYITKIDKSNRMIELSDYDQQVPYGRNYSKVIGGLG